MSDTWPGICNHFVLAVKVDPFVVKRNEYQRKAGCIQAHRAMHEPRIRDLAIS